MTLAPGAYDGLTPKQAALLSFIRNYMDTHPHAPSFEEMKVGVGLKSKSGVHRLIHALVERRYIHRIPDRARAICLSERRDPPSPLAHVNVVDLLAEIRRRGIRLERAA